MWGLFEQGLEFGCRWERVLVAAFLEECDCVGLGVVVGRADVGGLGEAEAELTAEEDEAAHPRFGVEEEALDFFAGGDCLPWLGRFGSGELLEEALDVGGVFEPAQESGQGVAQVVEVAGAVGFSPAVHEAAEREWGQFPGFCFAWESG